MVQGASLTCLAASVNGGVYGLIIPQWRRHSNLLRKTHAVSGFDSQCPLHPCLQGLHFMGNPNTLNRRNLRVEAGWLFNKGGEQELDASSERSESANEDILIFFFQLDLGTRVQVCWQSFCLDFLFFIKEWSILFYPLVSGCFLMLTSFFWMDVVKFAVCFECGAV